MTGRELIIFILSNKLEDAVIFTDEELSKQFMTVEEAAVEFGVGVPTVETWIALGDIPKIVINGKTHILRDTENPMNI